MGNANSSTDALQDLAQQQQQNTVDDAAKPKYENELKVAIEAVQTASQVSKAVFNKLVAGDVLNKNDNSPVTVADFSVQAVIIHLVKKAFPEDNFVAEESAHDLKTQQELKSKVIELTNSALPEPGLTEEEVLTAIDHGVHGVGPTGRYWVLDPIDGTKGFLRGGQYALCLALIENKEIVVGVLGCPNLAINDKTGSLLYATKGGGAFQRALDEDTAKPIRVSDVSDPKLAIVCESVEAGHTSHNDADEIAKALNISTTPIRMDSQAKYASVARGDSSIYLRLPTSATYQEKVWDHAAGYLIVHEAGGQVTDIHGVPLDFSEGRTLKKNSGVIATNKKLHPKVLGAVEWVLFPPVQKFKITIKRHAPNSQDVKDQIAKGLGIDASLITVEDEKASA
eukprot:TRINITY_DN481_c0_g1_i1.p1 TRINITY_DN481_c0_g1~~TRINITY_DN481_c0_g1_i1.p1  ORF type:complete len:427 (-),score=118.65 TRINITY_DN481_c0_g1_i1:88-1275(-)